MARPFLEDVALSEQVMVRLRPVDMASLTNLAGGRSQVPALIRRIVKAALRTDGAAQSV